MDAPTDKRPARRVAARPRTDRDRPARTVARQLKISPDIDRWLEVHALGRGCTVSELVTSLVQAAPTEYVLHRHNAKAAATAEGGDQAMA